MRKNKQKISVEGKKQHEAIDQERENFMKGVIGRHMGCLIEELKSIKDLCAFNKIGSMVEVFIKLVFIFI